MFARILYDYCLGDPKEKRLSPREVGDECEEEEHPLEQVHVGGAQVNEGQLIMKSKKSV